MASFDEMIKSLHNGDGNLTDDGLSVDPKGVIAINDKRQFTLPANFNPVIGYEGDVNSQIITFDLPATVEGHKLTECENKIIKWSNLQNGLEGRSKLEPVDGVTGDRQYLQWRVEPDVFVKAGTIQIAISFYDTDNEKIAFQWNTASFSGLSVAANASDIGFFEPAENEVLFISEETRRIVAPQGYNNVVCNYGDVGVSKIYFRTKRKIRGIDLLGENTVVKIRCNINGDIYVYDTLSENLKVTPYSTEVADVDGLVNIVWYVPAEITDNEQNYAGTFSIEVDFEESGKIWRTSTYNGFIIGSDVFQNAEDYLKNPDRYYVLDGELYHDNVAYTVIGGTYLVKKFIEGRDIPLRDREIVAEYDEDEVYKGLKVGIETKIDGEDKVELQSVMPEAATKEELNSLEEKVSQPIIDENSEWQIVNKEDQPIFKVDKDGAHTTSLTLNGESVVSMLNEKVDKVEGKDLSTNDYTDTDKTNVGKLKEIAYIDKVSEEYLEDSVLELLNRKEVQNISSLNTIYDDFSMLPKLTEAENGTRYVARTNGGQPIRIYSWSYKTDEWKLVDELRGSTIYIDLSTGITYRYTNASPNLLPISQDVVKGYFNSSYTKFYQDAELKTEISPKTSKIYISLTNLKTYHYNGSIFDEISKPLELGITNDTAFPGDYGNTAFLHTRDFDNPHKVTYEDLGLTTEKWTLTIEGQSNPVTKNIVLLEEQNA